MNLPPTHHRLHSLNKSNDNYPCNYLLVDSDGNRVIGHATVDLVQQIAPNGQKTAYIESLIIHKDYRKQGLGRYLMAELEKILLRDRFGLLTLKTIDQVGFYESIGFELKGKSRALLIGGRKNIKQIDQPDRTPDIGSVGDRSADDPGKSSVDSVDSLSDQQKAGIPPPPPPLPQAKQTNDLFEYHLEKRIGLNFTAIDC